MPDAHRADPSALPPGLYELLATRRVAAAAERLGPRARLDDLDPAEAPAVLARHLATALQRALRAPGLAASPARQLDLCNQLIRHIQRAADHLAATEQDIIAAARLLLAVLPPGDGRLADAREHPRPETPLSQDALFVHAPHEPALAAELRRELESADRVDLLCAFIVWSGVRTLLDPLRRLHERGVPVRVITTTYTGTTEPRALDELADLGARIKVSYDTRATRLHAKAWLFDRDSGFSTAYVGSSNLTHSAIHEGLEWNVRLSEVSSPTLLERFRAAFETYWADPYFEDYDRVRFAQAVRAEHPSDAITLLPFDVRPYPFQQQILERLEIERRRYRRFRNLVVAATGTGKTIVSALDYRRLAEEWGRARLLFVAHRREILEQSRAVFRQVLHDGAFGELFLGGQRPEEGEHVFASVQSLSHVNLATIAPDAYDILIVDEFHRAAAPTYRRLLDHFTPRVLLGLTATPERTDEFDVTRWFDGRIAVELRLWDALDQGLLCPFQYFGVADDVDLRQLEWRRGGYDLQALSRLYTGHDARVAKIVRAVRDIVKDPHAMRALGFCVSVEHARYMAQRFADAGIPAAAISADSPPAERRRALDDLRRRRLNVIFSVDLFNEGLDIPEVDTILFLRPTESATVFLQQLGRGLRLAKNKAGLTVLDFIGQQHRQFRFAPRFTALTGAERGDLPRHIQDGFPYLPAGCSIQLDRVAQQIVLENVKTSVRARQHELVAELRRIGDVPLAVFLRQTGRPLEDVYRGSDPGWSSLRQHAGFSVPPPGPDQHTLQRALPRMLHIRDAERTAFYTDILRADAPPPTSRLSEREARLLTMLHFDLWDRKPRFTTLDGSLRHLWAHPAVREELIELLGLLAEQATHLGFDPGLGPDIPLRGHQRYTRLELLAALGDGSVVAPPPSREGVRYLPHLPADVFLVTLQKTAGRFSPTTMYRDYAISPTLFHWESQSTTSAGSPTGQRYIHHASRGSRVLLFARETPDSPTGADRYLFLGDATYQSHRGDRPMAITWLLHHPLPPEFFQQARAVA